MSVLRTQLIALRLRPARVLLTGLALIVTAFVVFGTVLAQQSVRRTVLNEASGTPAVTDLVVTGTGTDPAGALRRLRAVPGVAEVAGRCVAYYPLRTPAAGSLVVAADPGTGPLARVRVQQGRYPRAADQIAVTRHTAAGLELALGDRITLRPGGSARQVTLTVTAIVTAPRDSGQDAYTTDGYALALADQLELEQLDVRLAPGTGAAAALPRLRAALGAGPAVRSGAEVRASEAADAVKRLRPVFAIISMFVAIAAVAAALVATSTFRIVFAQRMRQLALLRTIGAGRGALFRALLGEGVLTGLVAGTVGVAAAAAGGQVLPAALRANGIQVASAGLPVAPAVAVVLGAALLAALAVAAPALSAARVAPLEALRAASTTAGRRGIGVARAVLGALLAAGATGSAGLVVLQLPGHKDPATLLLIVVASGALAFFALVLLGPLLLAPVLRLVGWPLRRSGPLGRLAVGGIGGAPRRSAAVSVVVALGVTLVAGVLVGHASLAAAGQRELAAEAPADVRLGGDPGTALPGGVVDAARQRTEVTRVLPYREALVHVDGLAESSVAIDLDLRQLSTAHELAASLGGLPEIGPGRVALRRSLARDAGLAPGATLPLRLGGRTAPVRVVALLPDLPLYADVLADRSDLDRLGAPAAPTGLLADAAAPGEKGRAAAVRALRTVAQGADGAVVESLADQRDRYGRVLGELLAIALGLIGMTVLVAVVGVGSTTALSVVERAGESALLRAVGMSRIRLLAMMTTEAALYGVLGSVLGLLLALPYAGLAVAALGADLPVRLPAGQLAAVVAVLALLTAAAGLLPAVRASRVSPVTALAAEA